MQSKRWIMYNFTNSSVSFMDKRFKVFWWSLSLTETQNKYRINITKNIYLLFIHEKYHEWFETQKMLKTNEVMIFIFFICTNEIRMIKIYLKLYIFNLFNIFKYSRLYLVLKLVQPIVHVWCQKTTNSFERKTRSDTRLP